MDVQMPEMNGYEATKLIRAHETGAGGHVPIIAMTAYAMKGDREKCIAAGMDDYVSKPVQKAKLLNIINTYAVKDESSENASAPVSMLFDRVRVLDEFGGNEEAVDGLVRTFLRTSPELFQKLVCSISISDAEGVQQWAHTLKGNVAFFGDQAFADLLLEIENEGRSGTVSSSAKQKLPDLQRKMSLLSECLEKSLSRAV
jgi:response regulator RpfG family c-di-GMP phosphodiesterase